MLDITVKKRHFIPADFVVTDWETLEPYGLQLLDRDITTREAFDRFMADWDELSSMTSENAMWRYVRMSTHTNDEAAKKAYDYLVASINPPLSELSNKLNKKVLASPFVDQPRDKAETLLFKRYKLSDSMFRSENIPLQTELDKLAAESEQLRGAMSVELDGEKLTMQQASGRLFWPDRGKREQAWRAMTERRLQDTQALDAIFDQMVAKRHQVALNANYANYRDYMFDRLGRFDYTPKDCFLFHEAVEKHFLPILTELNHKRAKRMDLPALRPWDLSNDPLGRPALKAFDGVDDMVAKGTQMLDAIDPQFGDVVRLQKKLQRLDLGSRPHKRPGGYNAPMQETIVPFMFANVTDQVNDVTTFIHESGHAAHSILMQHIALSDYKRYPIEIAEVASMSMELFAFDKWHIFFADDEQRVRAQQEFLLNVISYFPWMMQIDLLQHEIYTHPEWSAAERHDAWERISQRFHTGGIDRSGLEEAFRVGWHRQTHVFSQPFYYIEYAIAQLGALQLWRNYLSDPQKTIQQYKNALALGYTVPLPELFAAAGIKFDFSPDMIAELVPFLMDQLDRVA